jgi:glycosyltransferase involved in cell wall biosynthesis
MNVLILRSNPIAPDPRVEKIARVLVDQGYKVICLGWDRTAALEVVEERAGYQIQRLMIKAKFGSGIYNLPALLRWQVGLLHWLWKHRQEYDLIHACDFDTVLPALLVCWALQRQLIYDIFDFYADHLRRTPVMFKQAIRSLDLWVISKADAVILVDESRQKQIAGSHPRKLLFIYNSPEDASSHLNGKTKGAEQPTGLRLAYIGLLQNERGLVEMLEILRRHPNWHLDMAGFGGDEVELRALALKLSNVTWYGRVSYEQTLALSQAADVLFATYDPTIANHRYSSPNKVFEAMMLGKPIIVASDTNMDRIIQAEDCGLVVDYGDIQGLDAALTALCDDPSLRARLGRNARVAYENRYSWQIMSRRLSDLYQDLTRAKGKSV